MEINLEESFAHLEHAPIVEAVLDLRAQATVSLEEKSFRAKLEETLHGYEYMDSRREYKSELKIEKGILSTPNIEDFGWKGLRFRSKDQKNIVQFNRNGLVFSRLEPYVDWQRFEGEALRLWGIYNQIAKPNEFQRIGLRFINRIKSPSSEVQFEKYFQGKIEPPSGLDLPYQGFMYQDTLNAPDHQLSINIIRTIQQPGSSPDNLLALILDIDVFSTEPSSMDLDSLKLRLNEMRWLKNKAFFGTVTDIVLQSFK